ncbi:hypothetical protein L7F22_061109 [Adiantum nelumboides]|nr:hypothetical protein [Adiantum nelumboides]
MSQDLAAQAVFNLISIDGNRRVFCKEERSITRVVQLLDVSSSATKRYPILVLLFVAGKKKCRKQMVAAGASIHLVKLVETKVHGAKKILDRLEGVKMWNPEQDQCAYRRFWASKLQREGVDESTFPLGFSPPREEVAKNDPQWAELAHSCYHLNWVPIEELLKRPLEGSREQMLQHGEDFIQASSP